MRKFFSDKHNLQADFADISDTENVIKGLRKDTKIVWIETPTNPTLKLIDINEVATAAKKFNPEIIVVCDNTFASPYITNPLLYNNRKFDIRMFMLTTVHNGKIKAYWYQ